MAATTEPTKSPSEPVRLALVAGQGTMRHIGRVIRHLTIGLLDEPIYVTIVAPACEDLSDLPSPPVELLSYPVAKLGHLRRRALEAIAAQLAARNIELLHAVDGTAHRLTRRLSDVGEWPYVVSVMGIDQCRGLSPLGRHCRAVLAGSVPLQAALPARLAIPPEDIHILRPGVYQLRRVSCFTQPQRRAAIIAGGDLNVFEPFNTVLSAFAALRDSQYECVFFILGNGKAERRLRARAKRLGLMHHVTFVDRLPHQQLAGIFKAADVFVHPHSSGALEMEILEAMAAGIPVLVAGDCVGDFVVDAETAISYDAGTAADLTLKLKVMLDEPDNAVGLATAALAHLHQHHSPAQMVAELADLYRQHVVGGRTLKIP